MIVDISSSTFLPLGVTQETPWKKVGDFSLVWSTMCMVSMPTQSLSPLNQRLVLILKVIYPFDRHLCFMPFHHIHEWQRPIDNNAHRLEWVAFVKIDTRWTNSILNVFVASGEIIMTTEFLLIWCSHRLNLEFRQCPEVHRNPQSWISQAFTVIAHPHQYY